MGLGYNTHVECTNQKSDRLINTFNAGILIYDILILGILMCISKYYESLEYRIRYCIFQINILFLGRKFIKSEKHLIHLFAKNVINFLLLNY